MSSFRKNIVYAFLAQGMSFFFSAIMSLVVPKILGIEEYSYWQLFIFYSTYVGILHFGLSDGIYLRYGGKTYDDLDKGLIGSQLKFMVCWQTLILVAATPFVLYSSLLQERKYVLIAIGFYLIVANSAWFLGFVFQSVNNTSLYSKSIIISKTVYILFVLLLFILKARSFRPFVILYIISQGISLMYIAYHGRELLFSRLLPFKQVLIESTRNIAIGINLMISNIASSLILGVGRIMVDKSKGISSFGLLSLAITLTNFFLQFIIQISMVLFPALRKVDSERAKELFLELRPIVSIVMCFIMVLYVPLKHVLMLWIPLYKDSFIFIVYLLPICVFDGKMQMIYNTYLKVYRKEKQLLLINIVALGFSCALCAVAAFILHDISCVAIAMLLSIAVRSIIAGIYLSRYMNVESDRNVLFDIVLTVVFIVSNILTDSIIAWVAYVGFYSVLLAFKRNEIARLINIFRTTVNSVMRYRS